jgi:hypothetical protein
MREERGWHGEVTRGPAWLGIGHGDHGKGRQVAWMVSREIVVLQSSRGGPGLDLVQGKMEVWAQN